MPLIKFSDPIMDALHQRVTEKHGQILLGPAKKPEQFFWDLCESIMGQQLSEKVAPQIIARVRKTLNEQLDPDSILKTADLDLRAAGLSFSKISYLKNVATAWKTGAVNPQHLTEMADEEVVIHLSQIKGVGRWTAEMFLMFTLGRSDVFSTGDYGLRRAISLAYKLPIDLKPKELLTISEQWKPNRTLASRILWKSLD